MKQFKLLEKKNRKRRKKSIQEKIIEKNADRADQEITTQPGPD